MSDEEPIEVIQASDKSVLMCQHNVIKKYITSCSIIPLCLEHANLRMVPEHQQHPNGLLMQPQAKGSGPVGTNVCHMEANDLLAVVGSLLSLFLMSECSVLDTKVPVAIALWVLYMLD